MLPERNLKVNVNTVSNVLETKHKSVTLWGNENMTDHRSE